MTEQDIAWAAGFVDGEGWVGFHNHLQKSGNRCPRPVIAVSNTHRESMVRYREVLEIGAKLQDIKPQQPHHLPQWRVTTADRQALRIAKLLLPHSTTKREALERVVAWYEAPRGDGV